MRTEHPEPGGSGEAEPGRAPDTSTPPVLFSFGLHVHQPVGNFDAVFREHVEEVYLPFLRRIAERELLPVALHVSGPLLEWLEAHSSPYLDLVGRLAADGRIELLLSGFYEPVLAALPRADRLEQVQWMREALRHRFGAEARGLWLTERVWEPDLPAELAEAGVRYVLVDDRHFLVCGFERERLHAPFWTESDGRPVALFPIDERLRYLIPFRPPEETAAYLRSLRQAGRRLAVLADDGEKFGGWPGTRDWLYRQGWLDRFLETMDGLVQGGEVRLLTPGAALDEVPAEGLAYLPTASYREMESWSLPPEAALRLQRLQDELGEERLAGVEGALLRGGHWRNFLVRYPEANRMHKKMLALSALCRLRGDPPAARRAIGRAQCNDAYWHGVFGGLYLRHLREAVWGNLAAAEAELRREEPLRYEVLDLDLDGEPEVWVHSGAFSALVTPRRGGAVEEYTLFATGRNHADVLTRRREAYHRVEGGDGAPEGTRDGGERAAAGPSADGEAGTPSIHELEEGGRVEALPPVDREPRALFQERVLPPDLSPETFATGDYEAVRSWAASPMDLQADAGEGTVDLRLRAPGWGALEKRLRFREDGRVEAAYRWDPAAFPADARFSVELSLAGLLPLTLDPEPAAEWRYAVATVSRSEGGLDETVQGEAVVLLWPVSAGAARVALEPEAPTAE